MDERQLVSHLLKQKNEWEPHEWEEQLTKSFSGEKLTCQRDK